MIQRKFRIIAVLLSLFLVLGLNIIHVNAAGANSLQVNILWEDSPVSPLTLHLREKLPDQDGYVIGETVTTSQSSHVFGNLDPTKSVWDYDVVINDVPNYRISYNRSSANVIDVSLAKIYSGQLSFPAGQVFFTANGMPVSSDYPDFEFVTTLTRPDATIVDLANIMSGTGSITINGNLPYEIDQPGVYVLKISQTNKGYQNFTFDQSLFEVEYEVVASGFDLDVQTTTMLKNASPTSAITFQNSYVSLPVTITIPVTVTTNPATALAEDFQVGMYDILPFGEFLNSTKTISHPGSNETTFEIMMFPDTTYQVAFRQLAGTNPYYTYDNNSFVVDLETDKYGLVTMTISDDSGVQDAVAFVNEYQPEPTSCFIDFSKRLDNFPEDGSPTFEFTLAADQEYQYATIKNEQISLNCPDELTPASFQVDFTQAGSYNFTIQEQPGTMANVSYDHMTYQVSVTVTDNQGVLSATARYSQAEQPALEIIFTNTYEKQIIPVSKPDAPTDIEPVDSNEAGINETSSDASIIATGDNAPTFQYASILVSALIIMAAI